MNIKYADFYVEKESSHGIVLNQTHSTVICDHRISSNYDADGHIFGHDDFRAFVIKTADCMPIFIYGKLAAAFLHVGHIGLRNEFLKSPLINAIKPIYAFIGPCICGKCYEVSDGFDKGFLTKNKNISGHKFFDLEEEACLQLATYYGTKTYRSGKCTYEDNKLFSYRRGDKTTRNFNIINLKR